MFLCPQKRKYVLLFPDGHRHHAGHGELHVAWRPVSVSAVTACQWPCWQNGSRSSRLIDAGHEICCRTCFLGLHHLVFLRKALLLQRQKRMTETKRSYWGGQKNETNGKAFPGIREACAGTDRGKRNQGIRLGLRKVREQDNIYWI